MKLSVSMTEDDLAYLDDYAERHNIASRSGAIHQAIRALRELDVQEAYAQAFEETANAPRDEWDPPEPWIPLVESMKSEANEDR